MVVVKEVVLVVKVMGVGWLINGDGQQVHLRLLGKLQREKLTQRVSDTSKEVREWGCRDTISSTSDSIEY